MVNSRGHKLRVISLRQGNSNDALFEDTLRNAGHAVTIMTSIEPAFSLIESSWADMVMFDPVSRFGLSHPIQRLRSSFDGAVVAAGQIPDPIITDMLEELGITLFASDTDMILKIASDVPGRSTDTREPVIDLATNEPVEVPDEPNQDRQLLLTPHSGHQTPAATQSFSESSQSDFVDIKYEPGKSGKSKRSKSIKLPSAAELIEKIPLKRWHRSLIGAAMMSAVIVAVVLPFLRSQPVVNEPVAKALPVVPQLLTKPLAPLTIAELSGETLPLIIDGIKDRDVIDKPAVAFWGDTAPDALVTVNGEPVTVSEWGAFVVDYPLDDGANFIEVLATDFQGRTTSKTFTIVSLQ